MYDECEQFLALGGGFGQVIAAHNETKVVSNAEICAANGVFCNDMFAAVGDLIGNELKAVIFHFENLFDFGRTDFHRSTRVSAGWSLGRGLLADKPAG